MMKHPSQKNNDELQKSRDKLSFDELVRNDEHLIQDVPWELGGIPNIQDDDMGEAKVKLSIAKALSLPKTICHAPSWLDPGEPSHMHIHLTTDHDSTQLNAPPCMGNVEYSLTQTSLGRQGWCIDSVHAIFIHLAYNTL